MPISTSPFPTWRSKAPDDLVRPPQPNWRRESFPGSLVCMGPGVVFYFVKRVVHGTKSTACRFSHRDHGRLAKPLVRGQSRLRGAFGGGPEDSSVRQEEVRPFGDFQDSYRAHPRKGGCF